ncbi:hypothetical protein BJ944DRAFT_209082 [Cunninghamella echinulata]|nr:hypothetical protein BJ944DRAFT_209082 [Cunninghamella echinulata]
MKSHFLKSNNNNNNHHHHRSSTPLSIKTNNLNNHHHPSLSTSSATRPITPISPTVTNHYSVHNTIIKGCENNHDLLLNGIGPYQFIKPLGNGKFSKVVLAKNIETDQLVAIKMIDKQVHDYRVMSRLVREIHLMELLNHPNIVKLYETFETADSLFIVMEYVHGYNLDEYLHQKGGSLTEQEARHFFRQLVQAIHFCHRHWIVHRDLKTPNILISNKGQLKVADFGLGNRFGLQRLRTICGSMLYYSPEIISNQKYYGPEVDTWCLGIALFRMTAGFEPFAHAHTFGELKKDVCSCNFPMPASLGPDLQKTILKCLQIDKRRRMTVRQALQNDPWLTNNGELPCPLEEATLYDDLVNSQQHIDGKEKERRTRRQLMRSLELEQPKAKRTLVYHPINPSTYFTVTVQQSSFSSSTTTLIENNNNNNTDHTNQTTNDSNNNNNNANQQPVYKYDRHTTNIESDRLILLQIIKQKANQLGLKTVDKWASQKMLLSSSKLAFSNIFKGVQDQVYYFNIDLSSSLSTTYTSSSSSTSLYHQQQQLLSPPILSVSTSTSSTQQHRNNSISCEPMPSLTLSSITTMGSTDEPIDSSSDQPGSNVPPTPTTPTVTSHFTKNNHNNSHHHHNKNNSYHISQSMINCMTLLKLICQLMGITYYQQDSTTLLCVLTLRDKPLITSTSSSSSSSTNNKQSSTSQSPPTVQRKSSKRSSKSQRSSTSSSRNSFNNSSSKTTSQYEELILGGGGNYPSNIHPYSKFKLISHLTSSMTTSFFARSQKQQHQQYRKRSSSSASTSTQQSTHHQQQKEEKSGGNNEERKGANGDEGDENNKNSNKKDGVAVFTMTWETNKIKQQPNIMLLRFSKIHGSSTVFKMAGGWITGVMGLDHSITTNTNSNANTN